MDGVRGTDRLAREVRDAAPVAGGLPARPRARAAPRREIEGALLHGRGILRRGSDGVRGASRPDCTPNRAHSVLTADG